MTNIKSELDAQRVARLSLNPQFNHILDFAAEYLLAAADGVSDTSGIRWIATCFTDTGSVLRISSFDQTILSMYDNGVVQMTFNEKVVDRAVLQKLFKESRATDAYGWGKDRVEFQWTDIDEARHALANSEFVRALATTNAYLMKRKCVFARYNNRLLADLLLARIAVRRNRSIDDYLMAEDAYVDHKEGIPQVRTLTTRTRSASLKTEAKQNNRRANSGRLCCEVCGFDFEGVYGVIGADFIETHHIVPIATTGEVLSTVDDVALVCSNCHRMLHTKSPPWTVDELRNQLAR